MKNNLYKIFTAIVLVIALGCSEDDNGPSLPTEDNLEGYWELDEILEDGDEIDFDEFQTGLNGMYYSFDSNGDFEAIVDAETQETLEGEWELDEKSLTLEYTTGDELEFEIVSYSENELKVKDEDDYTLVFQRIEEEDLPEPAMEITDAASLSSALDIEEAERKSGNIPYPSTGNGVYGKTLDVQTTSVIVTPNSEFDMVLTADAAEGFLFIKLDGTNEYFQVPINKILSGGRTKYVTCSPSIKFTNVKGFAEPLDVPATVQTFTMPLQSNQTVDFSNLSFWSPPKRVTFKAIPTGTGSITVTLTWDKDNSDVDLWLIEPDGNQIDYVYSSSSTGGYLDYDNTDGFGPENIFYDGDSSPLSGKYEVKVHYYGDYGAGPVNYNVVVQNGSSVNTYRGSLSTEDEVDLVTSFIK
jgi:hypothetical protein